MAKMTEREKIILHRSTYRTETFLSSAWLGFLVTAAIVVLIGLATIEMGDWVAQLVGGGTSR